MSKYGSFLVIIFVLLISSFSYCQNLSTFLNKNETGKYYEGIREPVGLKKIELSNLIKKLAYKPSPPIEKNTVFQVIGVTSLVGFVASVTIFKQELFGTLPLTLLGTGIIFIFLGA